MEVVYGIFFIDLCIVIDGHHRCDFFYDATILTTEERNAIIISTK